MTSSKSKTVDNYPIPKKVQKRLRDNDVRAMYRKHYSMREISAYMGIALGTVFAIIHRKSTITSKKK